MILMNTFFFRMRITAATETTTDTHFVLITTMKITREIGKSAKSAKMILKQRCMSIMEQMNTILKNLIILLNLNLRDVQSVVE